MLLAGTAFFVKTSNLEDRLSVVLTVVLTSVAYKIVIASKLPDIAYLTSVDKLVMGSLLMQTLVVAESVLISLFEGQPWQKEVDLICGGAWLGLCVLLFFLWWLVAVPRHSRGKGGLFCGCC